MVDCKNKSNKHNYNTLTSIIRLRKILILKKIQRAAAISY